MSSRTPRPGSGEGHEVVKWYTRARRFPQLIGKTPDGATIWGGPYTYTQVIAGVAVVVVGSKTTGVWGHFGLIGNALLLLGCAYGLVLLLGRLPVGSRNPLSVLAGASRALSSPPRGRLAGAPVRLRRPRRCRSRLVINPDAPPRPPVPARAPGPTPTSPRRSFPRPTWFPARRSERPPTPPAPAQHAPPDAALRSSPPALSGVQRLLASACTPRED